MHTWLPYDYSLDDNYGSWNAIECHKLLFFLQQGGFIKTSLVTAEHIYVLPQKSFHFRGNEIYFGSSCFQIVLFSQNTITCSEFMVLSPLNMFLLYRFNIGTLAITVQIVGATNYLLTIVESLGRQVDKDSYLKNQPIR